MYGSITWWLLNLPQGAGLPATRRSGCAHLDARLLYARQPTAVDLDREAHIIYFPNTLIPSINQAAFACFILCISCFLLVSLFDEWDSGLRTKLGSALSPTSFFSELGYSVDILCMVWCAELSWFEIVTHPMDCIVFIYFFLLEGNPLGHDLFLPPMLSLPRTPVREYRDIL